MICAYLELLSAMQHIEEEKSFEERLSKLPIDLQEKIREERKIERRHQELCSAIRSVKTEVNIRNYII